MVGIKPEDRDMLRFLWFEDPFAIKPEIADYRLINGELQGNLLKLWKTLLEELKLLGSVRIPRCYFKPNPVKVDLHGFSDASHRA